MNIGKSILFPKSPALRPALACEIAPAGVVAAKEEKDGLSMRSAFVPLPPSVLFTGIKEPGFSDRAAVTDAIRQALDEISQRESKLTLVIPDSAMRVLLLDFDTLPSRPEDVLPIIRFRLRKLVPFDVENAAVSYQRMPAKEETARVLCAVLPAVVLGEYEGAARDAGYEPGAVLPSTLASLAGIAGEEPSLLVNRNGNSVTTAIVHGDEMLLHRTLEMTEPDPRREDAEWTAAGSRAEDLQQSVSVAIAYYEDTLQTPPRELLVSGAGGAEELQRLLGSLSIPVRDLAPAPSTGNMTAVPPGMLGGVRGALA